jgi:hypothetical protein
MIDLQIDEDRNFVINNGDVSMTPTDDEGIAQNIVQRLRILKGEWFLDRTVGLPYFEIILEKNPDSNLVATIIKNTILETKGVTKLNKFSLYFDNKARKASVTFEVTTENGATLANSEEL